MVELSDIQLAVYQWRTDLFQHCQLYYCPLWESILQGVTLIESSLCRTLDPVAYMAYISVLCYENVCSVRECLGSTVFKSFFLLP